MSRMSHSASTSSLSKPNATTRDLGRSLHRGTNVAAGIATLALAHAVMIAVMVMTPLHMHHGGASLEIIGFVISVHVLGMFFLAPVVGWAADRFGRPPVLMAGAVVLLLSLLLAGSSAGARFTVVFPSGRRKPAFTNAVLTRSRDSFTAASGSPTITM